MPSPGALAQVRQLLCTRCNERPSRVARRQRYGIYRVCDAIDAGAKRENFLIVDCGPAHIAKKTRAFVESLKGKLQLFSRRSG
jgi:hypothetical protein